ncbi:MAG: hypothetical protein IKX14_02665 [Neisseriaceae bacterium]|nr:hypothetical protein [Neisseriaceae bacterium]
MKLRIKNHVGDVHFGNSSLKCSKQGKTFAEFDNVSPADIGHLLQFGNIEPQRLSISKRYYEWFPFLATI